jgi:hypothetical protein
MKALIPGNTEFIGAHLSRALIVKLMKYGIRY